MSRRGFRVLFSIRHLHKQRSLAGGSPRQCCLYSAAHGRYELPKVSHVMLTVYDELGRRVATLVNGADGAGYKFVAFNATNLASGMYVYHFTVGNLFQMKKFLPIR
jgi:hypothetical protein